MFKVGFGYAINQKLVESLPADVAEKTFTISPSPAAGSKGCEHLMKLTGIASPDPYTTQIYDHINLVLLAIAYAGDSSGSAIKDNVRKISQAPGGTAVDTGQNAGYRQGKHDGMVAGIKKGRTAGIKKGRTAGYASGYAAGVAAAQAAAPPATKTTKKKTSGN